DINNDNYDDILIAADDGYLRLISGLSGLELSKKICFNITPILTPQYGGYSSSPYSSIKRLFMKSGIKIYEIPDINDDNITEYI
ncbi:unnamed protein product, partial [marine sediment metagenome]